MGEVLLFSLELGFNFAQPTSTSRQTFRPTLKSAHRRSGSLYPAEAGLCAQSRFQSPLAGIGMRRVRLYLGAERLPRTTSLLNLLVCSIHS